MRNGFQAKLIHHPWASHIYTTSTIYDDGTYLVIDKAPSMKKGFVFEKDQVLWELALVGALPLTIHFQGV